MRAWLNLRTESGDRLDAFRAGLAGLGFDVVVGLTFSPGPADVLVTWNRIGEGHHAALKFEGAGRPVLVAENGSWGKTFAGDHWLTLARNWHNTAGLFPVGGPERWDGLGVDLAPWRAGGEVVGLLQRGIGANGMPMGWQPKGCHRIRKHPGKRVVTPLEEDLARAGKVITWGSGAAVKALMLGIRVRSHMPQWIAEQDNTDAGRLAMFRQLAWAQWRLPEIATGEPFRRLLHG